MTDHIIPFSNGSQYYDWEESNCNTCSKGWDATGVHTDCAVARAVSQAACRGDGVSAEIAQRMGYTDAHQDGACPYGWMCKEHQAVRREGEDNA